MEEDEPNVPYTVLNTSGKVSYHRENPGYKNDSTEVNADGNYEYTPPYLPGQSDPEAEKKAKKLMWRKIMIIALITTLLLVIILAVILVLLLKTNVKDLPSPCSSNPCPSNRVCTEFSATYKCLCPGGYGIPQCADYYLPMENIVGDTLIGVGLNGTLKDNSDEKELAELTSHSVNGKSLSLRWMQWIDLGRHDDRCLGNITLCVDGMTVACWFKLEAHEALAHYLFTNVGYFKQAPGVFMFTGNTTDSKVWFGAKVYIDDKLYEVNEPKYSNKVFDWHHIAFTWHPVSGLKLYADGELIASRDTFISQESEGNNKVNVEIGRSYIHNFFLHGNLDEMFIWESFQSASIIKIIYEMHKPAT